MLELENIRHSTLEGNLAPHSNRNSRHVNCRYKGKRRTHRYTVRTIRLIFEIGRAQ
jgi:hypothetical protein